MTVSLLDLSNSEKPGQIQENLIAYMRLFQCLPGMLMHDTLESFRFISNRPAPGNTILRTNWPDDHIEEHIDELLSQIGEHIDHMDWMVFPGDRPADLGQHLTARGMPGGRGGNLVMGQAGVHQSALRHTR